MGEIIEYIPLSEGVDKIIDYRGKTPKKMGGDWSEEGIRTVSAKNVHNGVLDNIESIRCVSQEIYEKWMKDKIQRNDIFIASEGASMGESLIWESDEQIVLGQRLFAVRANKEVFNPFYLAMYMRTPEYRKELENHCTGTSVLGLSQPSLLKTKIRYIPLKMQTYIGEMYQNICNKISVNTQINRNLSEQMQTIFSSIFYSELEKGNKASLGDYLYIKGRIGWKGLKKDEYLDDSDYRIINGETLTASGIDWNKAGYISQERYEESPEIMLQEEDILISKDGTIGKIGYVNKLEKPTSVASGIFVVRNLKPEEVSTVFIYCLFNSLYFKSFIASRTEGSVIPHLYQKDFVTLEIPVLSEEQIEYFNDTVNPIFEMFFANQIENERLVALRDALLPKLMSGELAVSDLDI